MTITTTLLFLGFAYAASICLGLLLVSVLLLNRSGNTRANRWLAAAVGSLALLTIGSLLEDTRLVLRMPHLGHVTDWLIFVVGPCVWLYVRSLIGRPIHGAGRILVHFAPAMAIIVLLVPFYAMTAGEKRAVLQEELATLAQTVSVPLIVAALQILIYWGAALVALIRYSTSLRDEYSSIERLSFRWLRLMLIVCLALWAVWIAGQVLQLRWAEIPNALSVPLALYVLAFLALRQPAVFTTQTSAMSAPVEGPPAPPPSAPVTNPTVKNQRDGLDDERAREYLARLNEVMETQKPWLDNELTLTDLAARVGISRHHLSELINGRLGRSFYAYINERRVREVQRCLADPAYDNQPIIDVALAAGFNSKAPFYVAFKEIAGVTPSEFRRSAAPAATVATSTPPVRAKKTS